MRWDTRLWLSGFPIDSHSYLLDFFLPTPMTTTAKASADCFGRSVRGITAEFNDAKQLNASGSKGCSHEWWHKYNEKKSNEQLRAHAHMKMREVAYFLHRLDAVKESNGRSILENSMLTISTESGDGRHSNVKRELSGIFHAVTSASGRLKTGEIMDVKAEGVDVYNTMLTAMNSKFKLGPSKREFKSIDKIRV